MPWPGTLAAGLKRGLSVGFLAYDYSAALETSERVIRLRPNKPEGYRAIFSSRRRTLAQGIDRGQPLPNTTRIFYSAAIRTSGAAARTSASTWLSYLVKFSWNICTSLRA